MWRLAIFSKGSWTALGILGCNMRNDETDKVWKRNEVASPCVNICVIEPKSGLCTGCLRSLDEIGAWGMMDNDTRAALMDDLPARKSLLTKRRGGRKGRLSRS